ncbi:MAG: hypothetical protein M3296_06765 [Actinomycetota bacterium]|nr:hypothetical protein [Actinomycetota bacterium]
MSALPLVAMMVLGSVGLWVGVPLAWLWIASQVQGATGSLGTAIVVAVAGVLASVVVSVAGLSWLSGRHREMRIARGARDPGTLPLEAVMVTSAVVAVSAFAVWFFGFSGAAPLGVPR